MGIAQDLAEEAQSILAAALVGSDDAEAEVVVTELGAVVEGVSDLWRVLGSALDHAQAALAALAGDGVTPQALATSPPARSPLQRRPDPPSDRQTAPREPPAVPPERVEQLRRELPPPVIPDTGRKTHGWWLGPDGQAHKIVSECDPRSDPWNSSWRRKDCAGRSPAPGTWR